MSQEGKKKFYRFFSEIILPTCSGGMICFLFLLIVFAVKGVFPFGNNSMAIMDMCHGYIPVYYHLYDFLHGDKSLFFDFTSGTGVNMVGVAAVNGLLSPMNLLFYLTSREGILNFINIFLLLKIVAMAVSAQIYFKHRFPDLPLLYSTAFSCLYALSGYVLLYYLHIIWLDVLILFPPLLYTAEKLIQGGRVWRYVICLALSLLCSFYLGIMAVIGIFFLSGAYVFVVLEKKKRPAACLKLGLGTAIGGLLPMFLLWPAYQQMTASSRYVNTASLTEILSAKPEMNLYSILMFYGLQLAFLFAFVLLLHWRKHPKKSLFALLSLFFLFSPLIIEGSARLWHFGSYRDFPYRFGFIAVFLVLVLAAEQIASEGDRLSNFGSNKQIYILSALAILCGSIAAKTAVSYYGKTLGKLSVEATAFLLSAIVFVLGICIFYLISGWENARLRRSVALLLCVLQLLPLALIAMGTQSPIRYERREHTTDSIKPNIEISKLLEIDNSKLERVGNPDMSLNINYGFIMGKGAISNWTHQIPQSLQDAAKALGYSTTYTLLLDGGGTVFSDALFHRKQMVSLNGNLPQELYEKKENWNEYSIYQNRYTLPIGLVFSNTEKTAPLVSPVAGNSSAVFENQNRIYRLLGGEGNLIRTPKTDSSVVLSQKKEGNVLSYVFSAKKNEVLYFTSLSTSWGSMEISVNGNPITVPSFRRNENTLYSSEYNNNCLELGVFSDEEVKVEIGILSDGAVQSDFAFGLLSLDKMRALSDLHQKETSGFSASKSQISLTVSAKKGQSVFLPVAFDEGWQASVNGKEVKPERAFGDFLSLPLEEGENTVELHFLPTGLRTGLLISLLALLAFAILLFFEIRKKKLPSFIEKGFAFLFAFLWLAGIFFIYIAPIGFTIIN